jgi:hypothetical protein
LIAWTGLTVPAFSSILLTVTFIILSAPPQGDVITNVDAGITALSGTSQFTCTIPVVVLPSPQRGLSIQDYETFTRNLKK